MKIDDLVKELLELKQKYPSLTNDEILKIYELHILSKINDALRSRG